MTEYRVGWCAMTNVSFRGVSDWQEWDDPEATEDDIQKSLDSGGGVSDGLQMVIEASGFEWWVETRESADLLASRGERQEKTG